MYNQGEEFALFCGICDTALDFQPQSAEKLAMRMRNHVICEQCGNADLCTNPEGNYVDNGNVEGDGSEISIMSISSTLTELNVLDLSLPSDLENDQQDELDGDDSDIDIGIYQEDVLMQPLPEIDVSAMWTDWPLVQNILILYKERFDELVRVWDALQTIVLSRGGLEPIPEQLLVPAPLHMPDVLLLPVPQLSNLQMPPNFNLATLWNEWTVIQSILDPQQNLSWLTFEQKIKEFIQVAELFAELVQYDIITPNLF